jgi:two-component system cell cycle sensor histidine kinase PleC
VYRAAGNMPLALAHLYAFKRLDDQGRTLVASANLALLGAQFDFATQQLEIVQLQSAKLERDIRLRESRAAMQTIIFLVLLAAALGVMAWIARRHALVHRHRDLISRKNTELIRTLAERDYEIARRAEVESQLRLAMETAQQANRAKSHFLANMSHELRTPLNAIIGFSDILRREMFGSIGSSTYRSYATDIHKSGQLLYDLLGGIIDLSAVEAGHLDVKSESLTAEQVIDDCRAVLETLARERDHEFNLHVGTGAAILGDRRLLRQVIINLTSNAAKYTKKGGRIDVTVDERDDSVVFQVRDNGIGMEPADIERALQPFTRLGDPMRAEVGGSGIGLALVKRLVEAMRGSLVITSEPGIGTTVEVQLPKAR